ncbi:hypothetical protein C8Q79DRAFT_1007772 [Trametes meyenii]|nr:hypothetical protein C8Q79DRAFT_1007772 [Trametes meyenii]
MTGSRKHKVIDDTSDVGSPTKQGKRARVMPDIVDAPGFENDGIPVGQMALGSDTPSSTTLTESDDDKAHPASGEAAVTTNTVSGNTTTATEDLAGQAGKQRCSTYLTTTNISAGLIVRVPGQRQAGQAIGEVDLVFRTPEMEYITEDFLPFPFRTLAPDVAHSTFGLPPYYRPSVGGRARSRVASTGTID